MHASWAVSAQGQGDRHSDDVGLSSVSSEKQIQHFRGSLLVETLLGFGRGEACLCLFPGFGEDSEEEGWLRKTVCESSEVADCGMLDLRLCCEDVASTARGDEARCREDCCR